jgi:putative PIN family toxin of toxin-antitoxin system
VRVVLDTNVVVSRYLSRYGNPRRIWEVWQRGEFDVLVSAAMLREYREILLRDHIRQRARLTELEVSREMSDFRRFAIEVEAPEIIPAVSIDPDDDIFFACAVAGGADYIVSGDRHLLAVRMHRGIPILTPASFLELLGTGEL